MNVILKIIVFFVVFVIVGTLVVGYLSIKPKRHKMEVSPAEYGFDYEKVSFLTSDGIKLSGWLVHSKENSKKVIILCHGYGCSKQDMLEFSWLSEKFNLLLFDFRAHGESEGGFTSHGWLEFRDVIAAANFLRNKGYNEIGGFGISLGAAVLLLAADQSNLKALVVDSPYASLEQMITRTFKFPLLKNVFGFAGRLIARLLRVNLEEVKPAQKVKEIKAPLLIIHGKFDSFIPVEDAKLIHRNANNAILWIVEAEHAQSYFVKRTEYKERVIAFFNKNL